MSWFTCTTFVGIDYPVNGAGGGFGMLVTVALSWFYLIPVFGLLCLVYFISAYLWPKIAFDPLKGTASN